VEQFGFLQPVFKAFKNAGYELYLVGGSVRDYRMQKQVHDYDLSTDALPDKSKSLLKSVGAEIIDQKGNRFGTVAAYVKIPGLNTTKHEKEIDEIEKEIESLEESKTGAGSLNQREIDKKTKLLKKKVIEIKEKIYKKIEITTYRKDVDYPDDGTRKPVVEFSKNKYEDLKRRDFTINTMLLDSKGNIEDPEKGWEHFENKVLKSPQNPEVLFKDDPLRILRAFRFSGRYGLKLENDMLEAMKKVAPRITILSKERVREEIEKILKEPNYSKSFSIMDQVGVLKYIFPEITISKVTNRLNKLESSNTNWELALAGLLLDLSADEVNNILRRQKFSNDSIKFVQSMVNAFNFYSSISEMNESTARRFLNNAKENWKDALLIIKCSGHDVSQLEKEINNLGDWHAAITIPISGDDLIDVGFKPKSKEIGEALKTVQEAFLDGKVKTKEEALNLVMHKKQSSIYRIVYSYLLKQSGDITDFTGNNKKFTGQWRHEIVPSVPYSKAEYALMGETDEGSGIIAWYINIEDAEKSQEIMSNKYGFKTEIYPAPKGDLGDPIRHKLKKMINKSLGI